MGDKELTVGDDRSKRAKVRVSLEAPRLAAGERAPFLAYFPSGVVPPEVLNWGNFPREDGNEEEEEKETRSSDVRVEAFEDGGAGSKHARRHALVMDGGRVTYIAKTHSEKGRGRNGGERGGGGGNGENVCQYVLGAFNRSTGRLQFLPVVANKALRMETRVKGVDYSVKSSGKEDEDKAEKEYSERIQEYINLTEQFGSKSKKIQARATQRHLEMRHGEGGGGEEVGVLLQGAAADGEKERGLMTADERAELAIERSVPPFDPEAMTPDGAYPLDQLILKEDWESLDLSQIFRAAEAAEGGAASGSHHRSLAFAVRDRLSRLQVTEKKEEKDAIARKLLFLHFLICFHRAPPSLLPGKRYRNGSVPDFSSAADNFGIPLPIFQRLVHLFADQDESGDEFKFIRPRKKAALLLSYIIVLALHLDDFESDPDSLTSDLNISMKSLLLAYREVGCRVEKVKLSARATLEGGGEGGRAGEKDGTYYRATLHAPLTFPKIKIGRAKR